MGNHISFHSSNNATGKIVYWDGSVQEFNQPVIVAELMLDHPQQVVVEFNYSSMNLKKRPIPLPADKTLELRKIYLMIPMKQGKPIGLRDEECRRILCIVNSVLHSKYFMYSSGFLPWFARLCYSKTTIVEDDGMLQRKESMENREEERYDFSEYLEEMMIEGRPEYLSRQFSGKGWKPSLDTIKEKRIKRKLSHLLFLKSF